MTTDLQNAMNVVAKELREDENYRDNFTSTLAEFFIDEFERADGDSIINSVATIAAENFVEALSNKEV